MLVSEAIRVTQNRRVSHVKLRKPAYA